MSIGKETITWEKIDLETLYQKCEPFDECKLRMEDPDYNRVLQEYLRKEEELIETLPDQQVGLLYACIEDAQECMSYEVMHFLRQGFLLGISMQLGSVIPKLTIQKPQKDPATEQIG